MSWASLHIDAEGEIRVGPTQLLGYVQIAAATPDEAGS